MGTAPALVHDTYYHIYNRGNNRETLFKEERNYRHFLKLYAHHVHPVVETFAYCLMPNHFHMLVRVRSEKEIEERQRDAAEKAQRISEPLKILRPSQQFSNLFNAYTKAINKACQRTGSLFEHPFGRIPVTDDAYFRQLVTYIHRNPQKHGFVTDFRGWPWSSYPAIISNQSTKIQREQVLAWYQNRTGFTQTHLKDVDEQSIAPLVINDGW
jgi:REP element-mobilizing transposase RayT